MAGRRDNNEGGIGQRGDGRWEARVSLPDGKRRSFYGKTKDEARRKMKQALRDIDAGLPVVSDRQTVGEYLNTWVMAAKPHLRYSTWQGYCGFIRKHIVPVLGQVSLVKLAPQQVQVFYTGLLDKGLSSTTVHHIHEMLHCAYEEAVRLGLVQRNILDLIKGPRRAHREMVTLTEEQVNQFLAGVAGDWFEALYVLAVTTGMREGELLGLRWQDIDMERGSLLVRGEPV